MSRRSQRIGGTLRSYQSEDTGSSRIGGGSSLLSEPQPLFIENSNSRTLRRKPSSVKRLSPTPSLGISSAPHTTSYYSESVINESYLTDDRGFSLKSNAVFDEPLESSSYWSEDLSRRRGTGGIESNKKINGLGDRRTYDTYGSSSGYSSEDDYTGGSSMDQNTSNFGFKSIFSKVGSFTWLVLLAPGRLFGLLYWWMGTMWYRLTTTASLLDVFILTRSYPVLKKMLLFILLLLLLSCVGYGAWYFYPFGLQPSMFSWGTVKLFPSGTKKGQEMGETAVFSEAQQQALSRLQALERRFETLEAAASMLEFQKRKNTEGATLSHEDILVLLDKMMTQQEAAMREKLGSDIDLHLQNKLDAFRSQVQNDFDNLLKKVSQTSEEVETQTLEKTAQWQSSIKEGLMNTFRKEMDKLEEHLSSLKKELVTLGSHQKALSRQVESLPGQIKEMREDVEIQFPTWFSQFLSKTGKPFVQHEELQEQLRKLEHKILAKILKDQELSVQDVGVTLHKEGITGVTEEQVHHIVNDALKRYSEDRIGMVDYALESGGASVISTRCSETYETKTALLSLFGIPLWYHSQSPRVILQPDVNPGNCWAFQGSQGFAVIRLSSRIHPTAVTLEHISKSLSPSGTIPSAPKDITVFGLEEEGHQEGVLLGKFTYNQDGDPIQTFHFQDIDRQAAFQLVELRVLSNWGHPEYTCIYRFRVHGELVS
ncbi:SUN domain-containing protein 2 isoform X1 [Pseudonaja textilis]|uniref:Sad1 and UNC84 domain containing 2 n=1 Tax=Pseudonaja textilis TaxID=8673 RepID=A0A670XZ04_PSETE|nr:SUN domain-containing protein 2 isoform X1 [Pseudonaja textilis]XP_026552141.1 SUN domain-containing protein 2 isoform X1 [Pseudonaja textilis]